MNPISWLREKINRIIDIITSLRDAPAMPDLGTGINPEKPFPPLPLCPICSSRTTWLRVSGRFVCKQGHVFDSPDLTQPPTPLEPKPKYEGEIEEEGRK